MIIIKVLGFFDLLVGIVFWVFGMFGIIPGNFITLLGLIILVKGLIFVASKDIASVLDIVSGGIILVSFQVVMPEIVVILVSLYLIQKGVFSVFVGG